MNCKHVIIKQVSKNKLVALLNYEKFPTREECYDKNFTPEFNEKHYNQVTLPEWESHLEEVEVHPDFVPELIIIAQDSFLKENVRVVTLTLDNYLKRGFQISPDRIEVEIGCKKPQWNCTKNCGNCPEYAILTYKEQ